MGKQRKISIIKKITISVSVLLLIPTSIIGVFYIQTFLMAQKNEIQGNLQGMLEDMQQNIDRSLEEVNAVLDGLVYRQELQYFLDAKNKLSDKEMTYFVSSLQREKNDIKFIYSSKFNLLSIFSANKQFGTGEVWQFYLETLEKKDYYSEIETSRTNRFYGGVRTIDMSAEHEGAKKLTTRNHGTVVLPVYQKIRNVSKQDLVGVVEIDIEVNRLLEANTLGNEDIHKMVLDEEEDILYSSKIIDKSFSEAATVAIDGKTGQQNFKWGNSEYSIFYQTCPETGLLLAVFQENTEMNKYIQSKILQIILIVLFSLALMVCIAYGISNGILKRLTVLDNKMSQVGEGDFDVIITETGKTEDEVTRITKSFNNMSLRLQDMIEEKIEIEKHKKNAELRALQAQINPHFLYNTLESMRMQCEIDEYFLLSESLVSLGDLFRYSISWEGNEVPFEQEWANLENYLHIMRMRFGEMLECTLKCDSAAAAAIVPKLMLQPLVENCFNHGFKKKIPPWKLEISALMIGEELVITVKDNGVGIAPARMERLQNCLTENIDFRNEEKNKNSIGITNVKQRIDHICGEYASFVINSTAEEGTEVVITIQV